MKRLLNELRDSSFRLIPRHASVLIALSGGPDSVCLTKLLKTCRKSRALRLAAAHVNHGLRRSAAADERWVRRFCRDEGLEYFSLRVNVKQRARSESESIEEAARHARYRALVDLARREGFDRLATAHTADDQAETVLMRLASGSGLWGLAAIPVARTERGIQIIRPLLGISKSDILAALKRARASYRTDRSNTSLRYLRNRVRVQVIPYLSRTLNPRMAEHLSDLAADAGAWRSWADREASTFIARHLRCRAGEMRASVGAFKKLPAPIRIPVYFKICEGLTRREQHLRREHIRQIEALLEGRGEVGLRLAQGLVVRRSAGKNSPQIVWSASKRAVPAR